MTAPRVPADRKAPAPRKAAARRPTPAEMAANDSQRLEAEAEALASDWVEAPLRGEPLRARPFLKWPKNIYRQVRNRGDFEALTEIIHPDDQQAYEDSPALIEDVSEWIVAIQEASGQAQGESTGSRPYSPRTRRR